MSVHDNIEYVYVGSDAPLWMCKFAMLPSHDCDYCQCQACHNAEKGDSRPKRKKIKKEDECDHDNLELFTDSTYFDPQYVMTCMKEKRKTVSRCSECLKMLTNVRNCMNV